MDIEECFYVLHKLTTMWQHHAHTRFVVGKIKLMLRSLYITTGVMEQALAFLRSGACIDVWEMTLDPRLISCTRHELARFSDHWRTTERSVKSPSALARAATSP